MDNSYPWRTLINGWLLFIDTVFPRATLIMGNKQYIRSQSRSLTGHYTTNKSNWRTIQQAWRVKSTIVSAHKIFMQRNFMLHFLIISHVIFLYNAFLGSIVFLHQHCSTQQCSPVASFGNVTSVKGLTSQLDYFIFQNIMILFWIILSFN